MGDASGNMYLWNASEIMGKKGKESDIADALISSKIYNDNVPILSIDSNPIVKSNIAFGGSEVRVISTEKDESYSFKGNESKISYTSVKWNKKVPNILASTNDMGIVNIWDLKTKKSIFNIQSIDGYDPFNAEKPNKSLCITWNPEKNTQIAVANDDDETPVVNIWELRNLNSPLATFKGIHKKGIKGITWYDSEPSYFVTVGKDHLAIVWDYKQATPAYEIQLGCSANSVQFIPQMYSHFVATSTDGDMEIMSMVHPMKCLAADYVSKPFSWKSKKCVGRFGFGGNFASVNGKNLTYAKVIMNDKIVENANKFEQVMECSDRHIEKIIETSSDILSPQDVKELQLMKAVRSQSKEEIFQLLGIDKVKYISYLELNKRLTHT
jgi:protein transport protein SEC31